MNRVLFGLTFLSCACLFSSSEFEEYSEHEEYEEVFALEGADDELEVLMEVPRVIDFGDLSSELCAILEEYVESGSIVIDYGAQTGVSTLVLSQMVGPSGKVIAFEPEGLYFGSLRHNLDEGGALNTEIHPSGLEDEGDLEPFDFENLSLIRIAAEGKEDLFLKSMGKIIRREKPVLLVDMLGGIPIEMTDRYVKEAFEARMEQLKKLGYAVKRINTSYYLALPTYP